MCTRDLPDIYAWSPRAAGMKAEGIHIKQITNVLLNSLSPAFNNFDATYVESKATIVAFAQASGIKCHSKRTIHSIKKFYKYVTHCKIVIKIM